MTMPLPVANMRIVRDLRAAETALDEALLSNNVLFGTLLTVRQQTEEAGPFAGHEILQRLLKSQQTMLAAASDLARVHGGLSHLGRELGAVIHDCPENKPMGFDFDQRISAAA